MKVLNIKLRFAPLLVCLLVSVYSFSQEGKVEVNHDKKIDVLLNLKKEMNKSDNDSDRYKIQVYSGNRSGAQNAQNEFSNTFSDWSSSMQYETPNFKVWAGNFRTRLEADRALQRIKKEFPAAFIFKPKK
ncbi:SPOR domain-containing protein [Flavobacteriaceae bacterium GSB9]|nr:SPOR domain-containing protein [Flavobacteriaceae bacterium GSB9]